jgi:hypothetical protein
MNFRRTPGGLNSLYLFFRVDKVAFCEGGPPVNYLDAIQGKGVENTHDIMFWSNVCRRLSPQKRYHFKSVGSKETLKSLASDVIRTGGTTVIVCLDSDFEHHLGIGLVHHTIAYTYGYSWENDIVKIAVLKQVFLSLLPNTPENIDAASDLEREINSIIADLRKWCEVDFNLVARKLGSLFERSKPLSLHDLSRVPPCVDKTRLANRLGKLGYRRCPPRKLRFPDADAWRHGCGKVISNLAYQVVSRRLKARDHKAQVTYDTFVRLCINETFRLIDRGELKDLDSHFRSFSVAFN